MIKVFNNSSIGARGTFDCRVSEGVVPTVPFFAFNQVFFAQSCCLEAACEAHTGWGKRTTQQKGLRVCVPFLPLQERARILLGTKCVYCISSS